MQHTSTCVSSILRFWCRVIFKLVAWINIKDNHIKHSSCKTGVFNKSCGHCFTKMLAVKWCCHWLDVKKMVELSLVYSNITACISIYLIFYFLIDNGLDSVKIKLIKLNPLVKSSIDCEFKSFKIYQSTIF